MSLPTYTENTIRNLLLKELRKRGVKAATEVTYKTPVGIMKPDAFLQDGGNYIVETKLGPEAKLFDALTQLYDYTKYIEAVGGFAILLPKELRRPVPVEWLEHMAMSPEYTYVVAGVFRDKRASQRFEGSLNDVADWISRHVLKPPEYVEPDTSLAISVLNDAVDYMTAKMLQLREQELEDIFGGKTVFENVLQYEKGGYPLSEMRRAATYLLINQILFYHVLSARDPITFPKIEENYLKTPSDLAIYFRRVLEVDYTPTFIFDVASRLPTSSIEVIRNIVKAIEAIAPSKIRYDLLGKVFHDLIPFETRKAVAAFYTNNEAAELLASLSIENPHAKVADLACGSGTLLVAAYHKKRELMEISGKRFGMEEHKRFLEEDLTGIDIMPFAAHLAVVHLSLQSPVYETEKVRIAVWDSTELKPGQSIPAIQRELREAYKRPTLDVFMKGKPSFDEKAYVEKGTITPEGIGGEAIPLEKADVLIMNPPFTRQQRIPNEYKNSLFKRLSEYEKDLHGKLGLYGYFVFLADRFLKDGGRMALVLPATVLKAESAAGIRRLWSDKYHVEYLISTWHRSAFSESVLLREILLIAKKKRSSRKDKTIVASLERLPKNLEEVKNLALTIRKGKTTQETIVTSLSYSEFKNHTRDWFKQIAVGSPFLKRVYRDLRKSTKIVNFRHLPIKIEPRDSPELGGSFRLLCLNSSEKTIRGDTWLIENIKKKKVVAKNCHIKELLEIPRQSLRKAFRRSAYRCHMDVSDLGEYVIVRDFDKLKDHLAWSKSKVDWKKWQKYVERRTSNLSILTRFDITAPGTSLLAYYSKSPTCWSRAANSSLSGLDDENARILCVWLNSTMNILQFLVERKETRGAWMEISKFIILDLCTLDPTKITEEEKEKILDLFGAISKICFPSLWKQLAMNVKWDRFTDEEKELLIEVFEGFNEVIGKGFEPRKRIDTCILSVLGIPSKDHSDMLEQIYVDMLTELAKLKKIIIKG